MTGTFHIAIAMKPTEGTFAQNALKHGVAGLDVDGCRIEGVAGSGVWGTSNRTCQEGRSFNASPDGEEYRSQRHPNGRWPANVAFGHREGCRMEGVKKVRANQSSAPGSGKGYVLSNKKGIYNQGKGGVVMASTADADGNETVPDWRCVDGCPVKALDGQSGETRSSFRVETGQGRRDETNWRVKPMPGVIKDFGDSGGASRFFKQVEEFQG